MAGEILRSRSLASPSPQPQPGAAPAGRMPATPRGAQSPQSPQSPITPEEREEVKKEKLRVLAEARDRAMARAKQSPIPGAAAGQRQEWAK